MPHPKKSSTSTAPQHLVCRAVQSLHINHMQMSIIEVFICRRLQLIVQYLRDLLNQNTMRLMVLEYCLSMYDLVNDKCKEASQLAQAHASKHIKVAGCVLQVHLVMLMMQCCCQKTKQFSNTLKSGQSAYIRQQDVIVCFTTFS